MNRFRFLFSSPSVSGRCQSIKAALHLDIHSLTAAALLTAMSIVLTRFASVLLLSGQAIRFGLGMIPLMIAGLILGPLAGGMAGFLADIIGVFINPMGPINPIFTLASLLSGLLPGLVVHLCKGKLNVKSMLLSWLAVMLVCSVGLRTLGVAQLQSLPFLTVLKLRMALLPLTQGTQLLILMLLLPALQHLPFVKKRRALRESR